MRKPKPKATAASHPLLSAVIGQLPAPGAPFQTLARIAWLRMMAQSFEMAYGPDAAIAVRIAGDEPAARASEERPAPRAPAAASAPVPKAERKEHEKRGCDYYVDEQGFARCDYSDADGVAVPTPGRRIEAQEALGQEIYDYRGVRRDRETIVWADGSVGAQPGMTFCGPG